MEKEQGDQVSTEPATVVPFIPFEVTRKNRAFKKPGPPKGIKMPKWTPERRAKFMRTMRRKSRERIRAEKDRKDSKGGKPKAARRAAYAGRQAAKGGIRAAIGPHTEPQAGRTGRSPTGGQADAIAYLRAATEGYEGIPTSVCYSLLALRRLLGQIK
jgi:hypothetical protein